MMREPDLPPPLDGQVRELVAFLADELGRYGERPPSADDAHHLPPSALLEQATVGVRRLATIAREFRNGAGVQSGAEPKGWRASSLRDDDALIARFAAGDPHRAAVARTAAREYDALARAGAFGLGAPARDRYIRAAVESQERGPRRGGR